MTHYNHGSEFSCLVCFLEELTPAALAENTAEIANECERAANDNDLKILFDKRTLSDFEILLIMVAKAFASKKIRSTSKVVYEHYFAMAKKMIPATFKRFHTSNGHLALRRRISALKREYGDTDYWLEVVSKHPMDMLRERAGDILRVVSAQWTQRSTTDTTSNVTQTQPSTSQRVQSSKRRPEAMSSVETEQRPVKHSLIESGPQQATSDYLDEHKTSQSEDMVNETPIPARSLHGLRVALPVGNDNANDTDTDTDITSRVAFHIEEVCSEDPQSLSAQNYSNFAFYFLQQYQDADECVTSLLHTALTEWIPFLTKERKARGQAQVEVKVEEILGKLKSLFFVSLRCKRDFEARKVLKAILEVLHDKEDKTDYWRFFLYEAYYFRGLEVIGFDTDLFQRLMTNLTAADKQVCFSLKFEALLLNRRWCQARTIEFTIPRLQDNVGLWIRLTECHMTLPVIHQDRESVQDMLIQELLKLGCPEVDDMEVPDLIMLMFQQVKLRYPIHFSLLADISAFFVVSVIILEGTQRGLEIKRDIQQLGLVPTTSVYINKLRTFAQHCFYGGFVGPAAKLYEELLENKTSHWEVWLCFGTIGTMQGNLTKAERYLAKAVECAELALGRSNSYASCLCFHANCLLLKGQYGAAESKYVEALRLCHQNRNHVGLIRVMHDFSCMYRDQGAFEASIQLMQGCLKRLHLIEGRDRHREKAIVFQSTSLDHYMQGDVKNANLFHRKCANYYIDWNIGAGIPQRDHLTSCRTAGQFWKGITGMSPQDKHKVKSAVYAKLVLFHAYPHYRGDGLAFGEELYAKIMQTCPAQNVVITW